MTSLLELRGVTVRHHGRVVLDVPALTVRAGERLAVMGPNGSGKSTLLRTLALLERPTGGAVLFRGVAPERAQRLAVRRRMASVFQASLLCDTTVYRNVALGLRFRGHPRAERDGRIGHWLGRLGIAGLALRSARSLSGGEAQRASLARALVLAPEVLFLDEAFAALDAPTREALLQDFETILRQSSVTTVFATHERGEALLLADRLAILLDGRIAQIGTPNQVFAAPVTEAVARFVGFENIIRATVLGSSAGVSEVEVGGTLLRVHGRGDAGETGMVCIRAEDIRLSRPGTVHLLSDRSILLVGTVRRIVPLGGALRVHLDVGFDLRTVVGRSLAEGNGLGEGASVHASIPVSAAHFIGAPDRTQSLASTSVA